MEALLLKYFSELSPQQIYNLTSLHELYKDWNQKINVISRKDMGNFFVHHVLHSLSILKIISDKKIQTILDVGTGGGFPGIPLAIAMPHVQFVLLDSIQKKINVVREVSNNLKLTNVTAVCERMEHHKPRYDAIVSRAVAPTAQLMAWTQQNVKKSSCYYFLKGGDLDAELAGIKCCTTMDLNSLFEEDFFATKKLVTIKV